MENERDRVVEIRLDEIIRPETPDRLEISQEAVEELAASIAERGLLQAVTVAPKNGRYEIVYGDRRYLAHKYLGMEKIKAIVRGYDEKEIAIDRGVENLQRVDLTVIEEARVYERLRDKGGLSEKEIAKKLGRSAGVVHRRLKLLRYPKNIQRALHAGKMSVGVGESLMGCADDGYRDYLVEMAVEHGVTTEVARLWVSDWKKAQRKKSDDVGRGGLEQGVLEPTIVYTPCDLCRGPEDAMKMKQLRICKGCFKELMRIISEGGS